MIHDEDVVFLGILWLMTALCVITEFTMAKHQAPTYLWLRITTPIFRHLAPLSAMASFSATLGEMGRHMDMPFWLIMILISLLQAIFWMASNRLGNYSSDRMLNRFRKMYPHYCPICVFVHYGLRRGLCEPGVVLPGHDEVHKAIAQDSLKSAEKRVAEREHM